MRHAKVLAGCSAGLLLSAFVGAPGATQIQGRVVDFEGKPVRGAEAATMALPGLKSTPLPLDAQGRFSLPVPANPFVVRATDAQGRAIPPALEYGTEVVATAPGCDIAAAGLTHRIRAVTLRLGPPRELAGRLVGPDGKPVAGVEVSLSAFTTASEVEGPGCSDLGPTPGDGYLPRAWQERYRTRTDAAGLYRLRGLPPGEVCLRIEDPRFVACDLTVVDAAPTVRLRAGCRIRGRIKGYNAVWRGCHAEATAVGPPVYPLSEDGTFVYPCLPRWAATGLPIAEAPIARDGTFLLSGLPPGDYRVRIHTDEDEPASVPGGWTTVSEAAPDAEVTLYSAPPGVVLGTTVDADTRKPIEGVSLWYSACHLLSERKVVSGTGGEFRIEAPQGPVSLRLLWYPGLPPVEATVAAGQETRLEFPARHYRELTGIAEGPDGRPLAGAVVTASWFNHLYEATAETGRDGRFRLGVVEAKDGCTLTARHGDQGMATPLVLKTVPPFVRLQLSPLPQMALVGRAADDAGRPLAGVTVHLLEDVEVGSAMPQPTPITDTTTAADGSYRFTVHDPAAVYRSEMGPYDYRMLSGGTVVGNAAAERRIEDIVALPTKASAEGQVVDAKGQAVAGARVFWACGSLQHRTNTDAEGRFHLRWLPERPVALVARKPGLGSAFAQATPGKECTITLGE